MTDQVQQLMSARTRTEATALAGMIANGVRSYGEVAKLTSRLWVAELLPDGHTVDDEIHDGVRNKLFLRLLADWSERRQLQILEDAVADAVSRYRSENTRARISLGTSDRNAELAIFWHLKRKLYGNEEV